MRLSDRKDTSSRSSLPSPSSATVMLVSRSTSCTLLAYTLRMLQSSASKMLSPRVSASPRAGAKYVAPDATVAPP